MPKAPRYQLRCAQFCQDRNGAYRYGDQWVHIQGQTVWVCGTCADLLGSGVGIPTAFQKRREVRMREAREQLRMPLSGLDEAKSTLTPPRPSQA